MAEEKSSDKQANTRWAIALDWFQVNNRSISALTENYLCSKCAKQFNVKGKETSPDALISTIQNCCSHSPDFISSKLPVLECIFRLYLSNGNHPLAIEELADELSRSRGGDAYRSSPETLRRVLKSDRYYGLQEISN